MDVCSFVTVVPEKSQETNEIISWALIYLFALCITKITRQRHPQQPFSSVDLIGEACVMASDTFILLQKQS